MRRLFQLFLVVLGVSAAAAVWADTFASKPLRFIVIVAPGGSADGVARLVAERLLPRLGQSVLVENRPGAGGNIATQFVAKAPPDGYTLLVTANNHTINPSLFANAGYTIDEFAPVALLMEGPSVIAVPADSRFNRLQDLIDEAKRRPGAITYGSAGTGIPSHIAGEMLKKAAGIDLTHVAYRGSGPSIADAVGGHLPVVIASLVAAMPHILSGKLKALAVTSAQRWPSAPDIPTAAESGLPGYAHMTWIGLFAPKDTPAAIVARMNSEVQSVLWQTEMRERIAKLGGDVARKDPAEFDAMIKADHAQSAKLVKEARLKAD
ncbi:MAG: tripartite tricarboxylate transporter substrate binding protein [Proteobacteria bacterium]|nr:tripartite tricarboxylate transporter substrate binding protein [Pseudomonadota bacterium]